MTNYDYKCPACNITREINHPMTAGPENFLCDKCGGRMGRVFGQVFFFRNNFSSPAAANPGAPVSSSSCPGCSGGDCSTC